MMKGLILAALAAAMVSVGLNLSGREPSFAVGFSRLWDDLDEMALLAAIGVSAIGLTGGLRWVAALAPIAAAALAAFLTARGLRIPDTTVAMMVMLVVIGAAGAGGSRLGAVFTPAAAVAGALVGYLAGLGGGMGDAVLLGGFAASVAVFVVGGAALGALSDSAAPGFASRIAAGVAGVGVYQLVDFFIV